MRLTQEQRDQVNLDEVRSYLSAYSITNMYIDSLFDEIDRIESKKVRLTSVLSDMPKGNGKSMTEKWTEAIQRLEEIQEEMNIEAQELSKELSDVRRAIKSLDNENQKTVLMLRYVSGLTWNEVVRKLRGFYSERQVFRIHKEALIQVHFLLFD